MRDGRVGVKVAGGRRATSNSNSDVNFHYGHYSVTLMLIAVAW